MIVQNTNQTDHQLKKKTEKVVGLMKNEVGGKIVREFAALRLKTYSYLTDDNNKYEKRKA